MRVRVCYSVEVDDSYRRAVKLYRGEPGLASREEIRDFLRQHGDSLDDDIMNDLDSQEPNSVP